MIAMLRPICSANTSFRDCGAMPASRFLSMDLFRSWNLKCCNRREIAGTKAETRYFNVTVLGSPLPSHVYHLQRSPLSSALRSYTFTICLTVVSHPVSLVDFPSFTVCYVRVSSPSTLSSSMYGYTSSIFLCKKMADNDNHLSSLEYGTQVAQWIRFVGWRGESIDFNWKSSLDRHAIISAYGQQRQLQPPLDQFREEDCNCKRSQGVKRRNGFWAWAFLCTTVALNESELQFESGKTWGEIAGLHVNAKNLTEPLRMQEEFLGSNEYLPRIPSVPPLNQPRLSISVSTRSHHPLACHIWSAPPSCSDMGCLKPSYSALHYPCTLAKWAGFKRNLWHIAWDPLYLAACGCTSTQPSGLPREHGFERLSIANGEAKANDVEHSLRTTRGIYLKPLGQLLDNRHIGRKSTHTEEGSIRHTPWPLAHTHV